MQAILTKDQVKLMYRGALTRRQAALYLGVSEDTIYRLIEDGKIGQVSINGSLRIPKSECDDFLIRNLRYK